MKYRRRTFRVRPLFVLCKISGDKFPFFSLFLLDNSLRPSPSPYPFPLPPPSTLLLLYSHSTFKHYHSPSLLPSTSLAPPLKMGIDGLWPLANSLTGPTVCNVTNRLDTAAHFMYGVSAERSLPLPPPIPDPSTDPSNSVNRNPSPSDSQDIHTPSPVLPIASTSTAQYAPIASTSNLNRQPLHPPPPSSSLNLAAALPRRPSYVDRPIATVKPIYHFVFETAPFDENEKRSMLKNLKTSSQPLAKFIKQHQYQVTAVTIKIADEYGRSFPGSMFSFVFEGLSTIKKKKEAEARARKLVEGQQKGEWKAEQTVYVKARKEKKYEKRAEATARKRVEKRTGVKPTKEGQKSGEGEGEGEGVRAEGVEGGGRGMDVDEKSDVENSNSPQNGSSTFFLSSTSLPR